jgi:ATP-dependent DNA ligase
MKPLMPADEKGATHIGDLQDEIARGRGDRLAYFAFDLLYLDGHDLRGCPNEERKGLLERVLQSGILCAHPRRRARHRQRGLAVRDGAQCWMRGDRLEAARQRLPGAHNTFIEFRP